MTRSGPFISVILPCRNEEKYLPECLDSLLANDYPKDFVEILIVDGMSSDRTYSIGESYASKHSFIRVIKNPKKILAAGWNLGLKEAGGDILFLFNAHAVYRPDYLSKCVAYLEKENADSAGGVFETIPMTDGFLSDCIVAAMTSRFGVGGSGFRTGVMKPEWSDSSSFPAYRRDVFEKIGIFNEGLIRGQDTDFHVRMSRAGLRILIAPDVRCRFYTRTNWKEFLKINFRNGYWTLYPLKFGATASRARHQVPLVFTAALLGFGISGLFSDAAFNLFCAILTLYFCTSLLASAALSIRKKDLRFFFAMPAIFFALHFLYGLGALIALGRVLVGKRSNADDHLRPLSEIKKIGGEFQDFEDLSSAGSLSAK